MKIRTLAAVAASAAVLISVSACSVPSSSPASTAGAPREIKSIYFSNVLPAYPPLGEANKCFLAQAKKLNINQISQAIANGYDAIVSQPIDKAAFTPVMQQAKDKGIYQATLNTGDSTDIQDFTIGTDYTIQGATVAEQISKRSGDQKVIILGGAPTGTNNLFVDGFKKGIASKGLTNVTYVENVFDAGDPSKSADVVSQALTAHPEVNVVLSWEGSAVPGIITAIKEKNLVGKVVGVTNDITPQVISGIKDGIIYGSSKQNFCKMGSRVVDDLVALSKGKKIPKSVDTGITFVTRDNVAAEGN